MQSSSTTVRPSSLSWRFWRKIAISLFIVIYVYCSFVLACPNWWGWAKVLAEPVVTPCSYFDALNQFSLFFPNPPMHHYRFDADVLFNDGSRTTWTWPQADSPVCDKSLYARFFYVYMISIKPGTAAFSDLCRMVARINDSPKRHPVLVQFYQYRATIPPFAAPARSGDCLAERKSIMYTYHVLAGDLR